MAMRPGNMQSFGTVSVASSRPRDVVLRSGASLATASAGEGQGDVWGAFTADAKTLAKQAAAEAAGEGTDAWIPSAAPSQVPSLHALAAMNPSIVNDACPADWAHPAFSATLLTHSHDHAQPHAELVVSFAMTLPPKSGMFASPRYVL